MELKQIHGKALFLAGLNFYGDPFSTKRGWDQENEIGHTWQRFIKYITEYPQRSYSVDSETLYEVHIYAEETEKTGIFEIFVGEEVNTTEVPFLLNLKVLPETDYLEVTLFGDEITSDWWSSVSGNELIEMGYKPGHSYLIQKYDKRFKGMDQIQDSILTAFIPIEKG